MLFMHDDRYSSTYSVGHGAQAHLHFYKLLVRGGALRVEEQQLIN